MSRGVLIFGLIAIAFAMPMVIYAQEHAEEPPGEGARHERTYLGIPGWILKLLNMLLFFGLLGYLLRRPIKNAMRNRSERIEQQLQEARERRETSDRMAEELRTRLGRLEGEVQMILQRAADEGERQKQELIAAANEEAEKILKSARGEVDARVRQARKELTDYAGELAAQRAQQLIQKQLTDEDRRNLFDESLDDMGRER